MRWQRKWAAMLIVGGILLPASPGWAQVVVLVNGEPITALDIEQRSKLNQMSTHKTPGRQEVIDELIIEKLKVREGKKFGMEVTESEVDSAFGAMASRMRLTSEQLTEVLGKQGVNVGTLRHRIRADLIWPSLVRGRFQSSLQVAEKDLLTAVDAKPEDSVGYDYTLRPILFLVPAGSPEPVIEGRRKEAEALRARFQGCDEGIAFARSLKAVAIQTQIQRSSADLPPELRKVLDGIEVGRLTPPETTKHGIEMFAICAKKESAADNTPGRRKLRETIFAERYEQRSKAYLSEVRRGAMIEYK
jgi:peptidyl-prolyl cis-trans isomerase SurA